MFEAYQIYVDVLNEDFNTINNVYNFICMAESQKEAEIKTKEWLKKCGAYDGSYEICAVRLAETLGEHNFIQFDYGFTF